MLEFSLSNKKIKLNTPCYTDEIEEFEKTHKLLIPVQYRKLLFFSNGISFIENSCILYSMGEIIERNETWETLSYMPGYLAIGDNGGGQVFVMKQSGCDDSVFKVDAGDMRTESMELLPYRLKEWVEHFCEENEHSALYDDKTLCDICLVESFNEKLSDLLLIKRAFALNLSISDLLKKYNSTNEILIPNFPYLKAKVITEKKLESLKDKIVLRLKI